MGQIAKVLGVQYEVVSFPENSMVSMATVEEVLAKESWTNVAIVHCETSSGVINPVVEVGKLVKQHLPGKKDHDFMFMSAKLDQKLTRL